MATRLNLYVTIPVFRLMNQLLRPFSLTTMTEFPPNILHQVSDHFWWFSPESRTDRASLGLVVGNEKTLMLECGASPAHTQQFLAELKNAGLSSPDSAVLTHWHWDHSFGMEALHIPTAAQRDTAKNLARIATYHYGDEGLAKLVEQGIEVEFIREHIIIELSHDQRQNLKLRQPDFIFDEMHHYDLGGVTCEVVHVGGDHSADSCVMYMPEDKVLFLGDCFYFTVYEEPRHYTKELLALIKKLEVFDAEYYIEGHSNEILSASQMTRWFALIREAFSLIDQHGINDPEFLKGELMKGYDEEDIADFLPPIIAGFHYKNP
jgi:glyoxylase-like metal-dependent hydrolase (beta-lactamase superfamily II)